MKKNNEYRAVAFLGDRTLEEAAKTALYAYLIQVGEKPKAVDLLEYDANGTPTRMIHVTVSGSEMHPKFFKFVPDEK